MIGRMIEIGQITAVALAVITGAWELLSWAATSISQLFQ